MKTSKAYTRPIKREKGETSFSIKIETLGLRYVHYYRHVFRHDPKSFAIQPYCELVELMVEGVGWVTHEGKWRELRPGDILWHKPGDITVQKSDPQNPYACLAVMFETNKRNGHCIPRFSHWQDVGEVHTFSAETERAFRSERFDRKVLRDYVASRLLFQVRLSHDKPWGADLPAPLQSVLEYMEQNYSLPCRMVELARVAGWSVAHLHEVFGKCMSETPHQWLLQRRLRAAKEELVATLHPIKSIALGCGFADTATFTHAFTNANGIPPREYREKNIHTPYETWNKK